MCRISRASSNCTSPGAAADGGGPCGAEGGGLAFGRLLQPAVLTWADSFRAFTTFHLVVVAVCAALICASLRIGRRSRLAGFDSRERSFRIGWGWFILATQAFALVWRLLPEHFTLEEGLPLQLCRWAGWTAGFAMVWQWRWARTLTYFWGIGLCLQGFVSPIPLGGYGTVQFWLFWLVHLQIVGSAMYDMVVHRYRPARADWLLAAAVSMVYVAIAVPVNVWLGTDYGWLGKGRYRIGHIVDVLGPWPLRPVLLVAVGQAMLLALYMVWKLPAVISRDRSEPAAPSASPA
jgi:hypothetical integral membrane protein (TIGR02206 family)